MTLWNYGRKLDFLLKETKKTSRGEEVSLTTLQTRRANFNLRYLFWNVVVEVIYAEPAEMRVEYCVLVVVG